MRKPLRSQIRFLRFLAKPLLIFLLISCQTSWVAGQVVDMDACNCLSNQSFPGNGQFRADLTLSGFTPGDTWYIAENEVSGLYHMASLNPPSNPIAFITGPAGFALTETSPGVYEMSGKHVDGLGFSIVLTNGGSNPGDSIPFVLGVGACTYPDPQIAGDHFVCEEQTLDYSVTGQAGSSYLWSLSSGGAITSPTDESEVTIAWNADDPGPHSLYVTETASNGCVVTENISIGIEDTIALACNNMVQVSLNSDCEGVLTADMFLEDMQFEDDSYELILSTLGGTLIPGTTITSDLVGQQIMVTVLHSCSSNSCWSLMTVEDKIDPEMNCTVDTVQCGEPYGPEEIGFPVTFLTPPDSIGPHSYEVQGIDLCAPLILTYHDDILLNDCQNEFSSYVVRRWDAIDGSGNTSVCYDTIKTTRTGLADLIFPANWDGLNGHNPFLDACGDWPKLWNGHPDPVYTGYPEGALCGNLQIDFTDIHIPICGENSFKVIRKWFVMDECTSEVFDTNQIIAIMDLDPPIVTIVQDVEVTTDEYKCSATVDLPLPTVLYECNSWTYTVGYKLADENGNPPPPSAPYVTDSKVRENSNGTYSLLDMPLGQTWVKYTVTDACHNATDAFFEVKVVDSLPPVAICDHHTVVSLNEDGFGYALAETFDDGSWDNCSDVTFKVRRGVNACGVPANTWLDGLTFCCDDIGKEIMVELQVTDAGNFSNTCMALVEVQDKRFPTITCPPDITVSCGFFIPDFSIFGTVVDDAALAKPIILDDPENPHTGTGYLWGYDGIARDNCGVEVEIISEVEVINQCGVGTITRVFRATDDQGNHTDCTQVIDIVDFDPFYINVQNPIDTRDDVIWPKDYVLHGCLNGETDPESLPTGYDEPVILDDDCSLVAYDYDDVVFQYVEGYCYKIVRTWKVIDWCQFDQANPRGAGYWEYNQLIMVVDDELPIFTSGCETEPLINQLNDDGCSATVHLTATATDDCTNENKLKWNYEIDVDSDGIIDYFGNKNTVSKNFPYGEHKIKWFVEDECGNVSSCVRYFYVEDHKKPTPVCYDGIVTVPMPTTGTVEVFAKSFNICNHCESGSYDNCTPWDQLRFSFSSDVNDVSRVFSCDDIPNGILDTIEIEMWVTDLAGNQEFCNTHLILQDNQDICPDAAPVVYDLAGTVMSVNHHRLQGVEIQLDGHGSEFPLTTHTNHNGVFSYNDVYAFQNYNLTAYSDEDPMGGISTLDLVLIQKHLLGLKPLDTPERIIAADINGSGSISAADLLDLRKLILGVYDELPNNDSWIFVDAEANYDNPSNPFPADRIREINGLRFHSLQNNFTGIKVGDVNESMQLQSGTSLEGRNLAVEYLKVADMEIMPGQVVLLEVYPDQSRLLLGMQFTLDYDKDKLIFKGMESGQIPVGKDNYSLFSPGNGWVTFSWNQAEEMNTDSGKPLFTLTFEGVKKGNLSQLVSINSAVIAPEMYTGSGDGYETQSLALRFEGDGQESASMILYQNSPNPFSGVTLVGYYLPLVAQAELSIFDLNGKLVYQRTNAPGQGYGSFEVDAEKAELTEGVYYYRIQAGSEMLTRKMIVIR